MDPVIFYLIVLMWPSYRNAQMLTSKNYANEIEFSDISGIKNGIVLYHVDWCGHCKYTVPVFSEFCNRNKIEGYLCDVTKISNTNINGFPTIKKISNYTFDDSKQIIGGVRDPNKLNVLID